jgi:hypothetical protein
VTPSSVHDTVDASPSGTVTLNAAVVVPVANDVGCVPLNGSGMTRLVAPTGSVMGEAAVDVNPKTIVTCDAPSSRQHVTEGTCAASGSATNAKRTAPIRFTASP